MLQPQHPAYVYACVLEPWTRLASSAPHVASMRLAMLPLLWWSNPVKASMEVQRMFSEKEDAWLETGQALAQAPMRLWLGAFAAMLSNNPSRTLSQAIINNSRFIARPANRRVRDNRDRLRRKR